MATDFWASTHFKRWLVDRATLRQARADDLQYVDDPEHLEFLSIYFANAISKLCKKLGLRQRVIATATVFFRRFYLKNSYCETDPFIVISACCYVAAKAEESPVHIKNVVTESRALFSQPPYSPALKSFPSDNSKLAEMEFYLVADLECDLTVFHPYRTLMALCRTPGPTSYSDKVDAEMEDGEGDADEDEETEEGEAREDDQSLGRGVGIDALRSPLHNNTDDADNDDEEPCYWPDDNSKLELAEGALQGAWFIINDTYRSDLSLLYSPHLIAIAAIYLTLVLHGPTRACVDVYLPSSSSSSQKDKDKNKDTKGDPISFLASLNISLSSIATLAQEIIALYSLWDRYKEDDSPSRSSQHAHTGVASSPYPTPPTPTPYAHSASPGTASPAKTPGPGDIAGTGEGKGVVTPKFLSRLLVRMREARFADMAHPESGRPLVVNRMLERAREAG